ncbi:hypothetical protein AAG906_020569 [Vitis piasezkii]
MDELPGALGTSASLSLRMGQTIFSSAALLFMCLDVEFYSYTAFCTGEGLLMFQQTNGLSLRVPLSIGGMSIASLLAIGGLRHVRWLMLMRTNLKNKVLGAGFMLNIAGVFVMPMEFNWELYKLLGHNEVVGMAWLQQVRISKYCAVMGLVIPWSLTLSLVDAYSVFVKCPLHQPGIMLVVIIGDWVLSFLSLAAACSTAGVTDLLLNVNGSHCPARLCGRYQLSAAMAFLSWFLSLASSLFNLWRLPSL